MSIWSKVWIISLLLVGSAIAGDAIQPRNRVTEPDRIDQHQRVQDELYEYINRLLAFQDSNFTQFAIDTLDAGGFDTVYLGTKYLSVTSYVVVPSLRGLATGYSISWQILSDSSFAVAAEVGDSVYSWIAIGAK